jgi:hypothetical protein
MSATLPTRLTPQEDEVVPRDEISRELPEERRMQIERFLRVCDAAALEAQANGLTEEILAEILAEK